MDSPFLTMPEAAAYLRVSVKTAYRLVESRKLPAKKVGHQWRIHQAALDRFMGVPAEQHRKQVA